MDEESRRVVITVTLRKRGPERVEADALHVALTDAQPVDSVDLAEGVTVDLDERGSPAGLEILDASVGLGRGVWSVRCSNVPARCRHPSLTPD